MDQVKKIAGILWTNRLWIVVGTVLVLSALTSPLGSSRLMARAEAKKKEIDGSFESIGKFKNGAHPNGGWTKAVAEKTTVVSELTEKVWREVYLKQEELMTWPDYEGVKQRFTGRPFLADLSDERNQFLISYRRGFPQYVADVYYLLNPISVDQGVPYGVVDSGVEVLSSAVWETTPKSNEAWAAQEELWIQNAVIAAVADLNKGAKDWSEGIVRKIRFIGLGLPGVDSRTRSTSDSLTLLPVFGETDPAAAAGMPVMNMPTSGASGSFGMKAQFNRVPNVFRYLEKMPQYRTVPLYVSMLVDQREVSKVVAAMNNAAFRFTVLQVNLGLPDTPVTTPLLYQEVRGLGESGVRDDAAFNTIQLDVWGKMRIFEMPPGLKAERFPEKAPPADAAEKKA
ncbi:MAG: hypothetical protein ACRC1K_13050 [Planctomycetia bacterium]